MAIIVGGVSAPQTALALAQAPSVTTGAAAPAGEAFAVLQGEVNPNGSVITDCHFEYGLSVSYGSTVPCTPEAGGGSEPVSVSAPANALQPGGTYYFRLVASSAGGTSYGLQEAFQTAYPRTSAQLPAQTKRQHLHGSQNASDIGLYVAFCPVGPSAAASRAHTAGTSEKGWPPKQCLKMDKGSAGGHHTIIGVHGVHNWLLGGYGSDTIIGGNIGDVIWGDYHPSGEPKHQTATIRAGNGRNVIYANDSVNYVWTGTNPRTIVHAHGSGIGGVIHCGSSQQVMFLSTVSEKHFKLMGCGRISHYSVGY